MDTAADYRVLVAERIETELAAVSHGNRLRGQFNKGAFEAAVSHLKTEVLSLKYSYGESGDLETSASAKEVVAAATRIEESLGGPQWQVKIKEDRMAAAFVRFALANLKRLPQRFRLPGNHPENAIDLHVGEVLSAHRHPDADNLIITNVDAGHAFTIVTNDVSVRSGAGVAVAHLPPTELRGTLSEAMFCGIGGKVMTGVAGKKGDRPVLPENAYVQVRNVLSGWLKK